MINPQDAPANQRATPFEQRMMLRLIRRARQTAVDRSADHGIVAALCDGERIVAIGVNHVDSDHDISGHAEIVAFRRAGRRLGDVAALAGLTLYSTLQPCEMCLSAARFAGVTRILFSAAQQQVPARYFAFPGLGIDDFLRASDWSPQLVQGLFSDRIAGLYIAQAD